MNILIKPILTEKALIDQERGRYHFMVDPQSTKKQIAAAFKSIFSSTPVAVNIINRLGKIKTDWRRRQKITKNKLKIAIITLPKGEKIDSLILPKK